MMDSCIDWLACRRSRNATRQRTPRTTPAEPSLVSASIRSLEDSLCHSESLANRRIRLNLVQHREHVQAACNTSIVVTKQPDPDAMESLSDAQLDLAKAILACFAAAQMIGSLELYLSTLMGWIVCGCHMEATCLISPLKAG